MRMTDGGIAFGADGAVSIGPAFVRLQAAWMAGVALRRAGFRRVVYLRDAERLRANRGDHNADGPGSL